MFGIKIISQKEYDEALEHHRLTMRLACDRLDENKKLKSDIESLREQNVELRKRYNNAVDLEFPVITGTAKLKDLHIVFTDSRKCEKCMYSNSKVCKKLMFANRTICVAHKDHINPEFKTNKKK